MATKRSNQWAAVSCVCIGLGLVVVIGALVFEAFGRPRQLNTTSALSEWKWVEPEVIHAAAMERDALQSGRRAALQPATDASDHTNPPDPAQRGAGSEQAASIDPTVVFFAIEGIATSAAPTTTNAPLTTPTSANSTTASPLSAGNSTTTANSTTAAGTITDTRVTTVSSAEADPEVTEPPPGAEQGFTYCGATTCTVGFKCCCSACVPFEQECDPRSCAAQSGLSVSVPCGMDLCDPGDICCDPRCGACAEAGECPEEPCR